MWLCTAPRIVFLYIKVVDTKRAGDNYPFMASFAGNVVPAISLSGPFLCSPPRGESCRQQPLTLKLSLPFHDLVSSARHRIYK